MKKRILSLMLSICLFVQLFTAINTVYAANGYNPKVNTDFIIPAVLRSNRDFILGSTLRGTQANFINKMGLNGNTTYKDFDTDSKTDIGAISQELRAQGQLSYTYGGRVKNSRDNLNKVDVETFLQFNSLILYPPSRETKVFLDFGMYENFDTEVPMSYDTLRLQAVTRNAKWYTTATQTKDLAVYVFDQKAPTVESCEITQNGNVASFVQLGSTIRFTLNFSEYIRFADNSASNKPGLQFEILPYGKIVSDPIRLKAEFVELYDNKMVFEYTFANEYSGHEGIKEFYISKIEKITQQPDFSAKYDLAMLPQDIATAANVPKITVNNLITDLAGNAAEEVLITNESGAVTGEREIPFNSVKIDSQIPSVQNIKIEKNPSYDTGKDQVLYAKIGNNIKLSVTFDEPVYASADSVTLTLNIKDSSGKTVMIKNDTDVSGGTLMTFEEFEITEGMTYTDNADTPGKITPKSIDGTAVTDVAKNSCGIQNLMEKGIYADTDLALDTLPPIIDLGSDENITPITNFSDSSIFCIPITISDDSSSNNVAVSGVDTKQGYFYFTGFPNKYTYIYSDESKTLFEKQDFMYYVSNTVMAESELETQWKTSVPALNTSIPEHNANKFDLYSGGTTYLYIKIGNNEIENPTLYVGAEDVAGNKAIASKQVNYTYDTTTPAFGAVSDITITKNENVTNTYDISCTITCSDENGINPESFRVTAEGLFENYGLGSNPGIEYIGGVDIIDNGSSDDGKTRTFTLVMREVMRDTSGNYNITYQVEDNHGNANQITSPFSYNLTSFHLLSFRRIELNEYVQWMYFVTVDDKTDFTENAKTILMVKDPYAEEDCYAVTIIDKNYNIGSNVLLDNNLSWGYYKRSKNPNESKQILLEDAAGSVDFINALSAQDQYFGDASYMLISGDNISIDDFKNSDDLPVPISITEDTVRMSGFKTIAVNGTSLAPDFEIEPIDWQWDPFSPQDDWSMPITGEDGLKTYNIGLAGKSVKVKLTLPEIDGSGVLWSDYENVFLQLKYYDTSNYITEKADPIWQVPLQLTEDEQIITFPETLDEDFFREGFSMVFHIQAFLKSDTGITKGVEKNGSYKSLASYKTRDTEGYISGIIQHQNIPIVIETVSTTGQPMTAYSYKEVLHEWTFSSVTDTDGQVIPIYLAQDSHIELCIKLEAQKEWIRFWNEAKGETKEEAAWDGNWNINYFEEHFTEDPVNIIYYQTFSKYNGLSEIHTIIFDSNQQAPTLSVGLTPSPDEGYATQRRLVINELKGKPGEELNVKMIIQGSYDPIDFTEDDNAIVRDEKSRTLYVMDSSTGAFAYTIINAEKIDTQAPTITVKNTYPDTFDISITDDIFIEDMSGMELYLKYDDKTYTEKLKEYGLLTDEEGYFRIEEFSQIPIILYPENRSMGIQEFAGNIHNADKEYTAAMTFTAPAGSGGYDGTISMYVIDRAGRKSNIATVQMNIPEIDFSNSHFSYDRTSTSFGPEGNLFVPYFNLNFNHPAEVIEPASNDKGIRMEINDLDPLEFFAMAMPIYKDGEYTMTVKDFFGDTHEITYSVPSEAFDGDRLDIYAVNAKDGDTDIVNLIIKSIDGKSFQVELPNADDYDHDIMEGMIIDPSMKAGEATVWQADGSPGEFGASYSEATLKVTKNGTFKVLIPNNSGFITEYLVNVYINKEVAEIDAKWSFPNGLFEDENGNKYTYDYATFVVDTVDPQRFLIGESTFNFTYNDPIGTEKTFTVTDDNGFMQECTAKLDFEIRKSEQEYSEPPEMTLSVYAQRSNVSSLLGSIREDQSNRYSELIDLYGGATQYSLSASAISPNSTKTVLLPYQGDTSKIQYDTAQNAEIDGVEVTGDVLYINTEDARFSLVMIDENDLLSKRFDFDGGFIIDTLPPVISDVNKTVKGYSVELEITATDNLSGFDELTVLSPGSVTRKNDKFIYTAEQNGNVVFVIQDLCGNYVTHTISVAEIDDTKPTAKLVAYSPSSNTSQLLLPTVTNRDIEAFITFNKNIKDLSLEIQHNGVYIAATEADGVNIEKNTENSATVTFTKGAHIRVQYTSLNGQSGIPLEINVPDSVIDKRIPNIHVEVEYNRRAGASNPISATIRAYSDDKTVFYGRGAYTKDVPFEETVYTNNIYEYSFTDNVGNVIKASADVNQIDEKKLELMAYDIPDQFTPSGTEFKLLVNKPASITLGNGLTTNDSLTVTDKNGAVLDITAQNSGFYTITAVDEAGGIVNCFVSIAIGDSMPPVIMADSDYVYIRQGSDIVSLDDDMLTSGLLVTDDKSDTENITLTVDRSGLPADLNTIGNYAYTVTATDEAGNTTDIRRYLSVYSKNSVAVEVDNIFTKHTGVVTTSMGEHIINVSLPDNFISLSAFEPYNVYCTKGFYTEGQMKPWMQPMTAAGIKNGINDEYRYNFEQEGWYTIYVLRQNREVFLIHLLIQ